MNIKANCVVENNNLHNKIFIEDKRKTILNINMTKKKNSFKSKRI